VILESQSVFGYSLEFFDLITQVLAYRKNILHPNKLKNATRDKSACVYLARSIDYDRIGGSPEYTGWGYEDLGLWARVQAFFDYKRSTDGDMYFNNKSVSTDYPIIHLWHSTTNRENYFAPMEKNKKLYENYLALTREEKVKTIKPLGKY